MSPDTLAGLAARGIRLNPNATDTDGDGLADGQELFVKSAKAPMRYPTRDQQSAETDGIGLSPAVHAWGIVRVDGWSDGRIHA